MRGSGPKAVEAARLPKHRVPATGPHHVARPRLQALVEGALATPVTVVVAPAGSGKTTLLSEWASSSRTPVAWVSLDETDRDPVRFWSEVGHACEELLPGSATRAVEHLRRPGAVLAAVAELAEDLEALPGPAVLVVDPLHLVDDEPVVAESLARFVADLPAPLHVVLVSRREPPLALSRMRGRGELTEVHFDELRFAEDEARELLHNLAPSLPEDRLAAAVERADGWAASLQLAALAARSAQARPLPGAPGLDEDVLIYDYVMNEVLSAEDPTTVGLLIDTAVVQRLNGSLAEALTGQAGAEGLLLEAERRGLFVTRLGADGWFEVHSLVRRALDTALSRSPQRRARQHARAAAWYLEAGDTPAALEHLLLAGDRRGALRLLATRHADLYDDGLEATVRRVIGAIPDEVASEDLEAMTEYAWCHLLVDRHRFTGLVDRLTWAAPRSPGEPLLEPRAQLLGSIAASVNGDWDRGGELARRALDGFGEAWWRDPIGRFGWNMVAREIALGERWNERGDAVRQVDVALSRDPRRRLALEGTRALGEALAGRTVDALRLVAGVRRAVDATSLTILRGELALAEALATRELGDRGRALELLEEIAATPAAPLHIYRVLATVELATAALDDGDHDAAAQSLGRAVELVEGQGGAGWWGWLNRAAARIATARGELAEARRWAEAIDDGFWRPVTEARTQLGEGGQDRALTTLEAADPRCPRHQVVLSLVRAQALPPGVEADRELAAAVDVAVANGMLQVVASEGRGLLDRIERVAWWAPAEWVDRLRRTSAPLRAPRPADTRGEAFGLTDRERDVLRFLPSRLTQREIADELYVSVNTLKFHLKVIYRKLGVGTRAEAAEVARRLANGAGPPRST